MRVAVVAAAVVVGLVATGSVVVASPTADPRPRVLVFTKTTGFRHASIPAAVRAVRSLAAGTGIRVDATEDAAAFTSGNLARYDAVVFLLTTGDVLDARQQAAFQRYIRAGGGFAGVHSATDTEYGWAWYGRLVGAYFRSHPAIQRATVRIERRNRPSTVRLPSSWARTDEWYAFRRNPRRSVRVLATLDESTYAPGDSAMGTDHPIAWEHEFEGGRAWYTAGGHGDEAYGEPLFRQHLLGGIRYAAGLSPPRIHSISVRRLGRRIRFVVRLTGCRPCAGTVRIGGSRTSLRFAGDRGVGTSGSLAPGRHQAVVTLVDRPTGLRDIARRTVRVR